MLIPSNLGADSKVFLLGVDSKPQVLILRYIFYIFFIPPFLSSFLILSGINHSHSISGAVVNVESASDNKSEVGPILKG